MTEMKKIQVRQVRYKNLRNVVLSCSKLKNEKWCSIPHTRKTCEEIFL
jgi:hypothetical protein